MRFVFRDGRTNRVKIFIFQQLPYFHYFLYVFLHHEGTLFFFFCPFRWWVGIFIQEGNKDSTSTFLKLCLFLSFSLCFGVCSSLFRTRYILLCSLCVGTVSYGSYVLDFGPYLESVAECLVSKTPVYLFRTFRPVGWGHPICCDLLVNGASCGPR